MTVVRQPVNTEEGFNCTDSKQSDATPCPSNPAFSVLCVASHVPRFRWSERDRRASRISSITERQPRAGVRRASSRAPRAQHACRIRAAPRLLTRPGKPARTPIKRARASVLLSNTLGTDGKPVYAKGSCPCVFTDWDNTGILGSLSRQAVPAHVRLPRAVGYRRLLGHQCRQPPLEGRHDGKRHSKRGQLQAMVHGFFVQHQGPWHARIGWPLPATLTNLAAHALAIPPVRRVAPLTTTCTISAWHRRTRARSARASSPWNQTRAEGLQHLAVLEGWAFNELLRRQQLPRDFAVGSSGFVRQLSDSGHGRARSQVGRHRWTSERSSS